jgi:hypothetical protein
MGKNNVCLLLTEEIGFSHIMGLSSQERISHSDFMKVVMVIHIKNHIIESRWDEILGSTKGYFIICYLLSPNIIGQLNRG